MPKNSKYLQYIKFNPLTCSSCTLSAQIMAWNEKNIKNMKVRAKSYLGKFYEMDMFCKKIRNSKKNSYLAILAQ